MHPTVHWCWRRSCSNGRRAKAQHSRATGATPTAPRTAAGAARCRWRCGSGPCASSARWRGCTTRRPRCRRRWRSSTRCGRPPGRRSSRSGRWSAASRRRSSWRRPRVWCGSTARGPRQRRSPSATRSSPSSWSSWARLWASRARSRGRRWTSWRPSAGASGCPRPPTGSARCSAGSGRWRRRRPLGSSWRGRCPAPSPGPASWPSASRPPRACPHGPWHWVHWRSAWSVQGSLSLMSSGRPLCRTPCGMSPSSRRQRKTGPGARQRA
mmetsp:Transcript_126674/g.352974  ORF Transcript_126674/g.352974 Transcript_126674/m.352974 type:complete len:268 (-) Transcript_126674:246-1049(-)